MRALWHHTWAGPRLRDYPDDVKAGLTRVVLGMGQGPGDGSVGYYSGNGQTDADHAADIRAFEAAGIRVSLGVGGSDDKTAIASPAQAAAFARSVTALAGKFGFTGVDLDLEPGTTAQWTVAAVRDAVSQLRAAMPGFRVSLTGSLWGTYTARWVELFKAIPGCDYVSSMNYDIPEATDARLTSVVQSRTADLVSRGVPLERQVVGFMPQPYAGYNASPPAVIQAAWKAAVAKYPTLGGWFLWEDQIEKNQNWDSTRRLLAA